jgi:hypothetical protein
MSGRHVRLAVVPSQPATSARRAYPPKDMPRHHLVPQMYLRRFADDESRLTAVPRDKAGQRVTLTVRKAAAEVGFYAIPADDLEPHARQGHDPEVVEHALADIESACASHIDRILDGEIPPPTETARLQLSLFIALQHTRGWRFRRDLADLARLTAPAFIRQSITADRVRATLKATGRPAAPKDVEDMLVRLTGPNGPKPVLRQAMYVQHAVQNAIEVVAPTLFARRWRLLEFPKPCLAVSDEPVAVPVITGKGAANVSELWFPLDRSHALELALRGSEKLVQAPLGKARKINRLTASQAERWIFHHPDDDPLADLDIGARTGFVEKVEDLVEAGKVVGEMRRVVRAPIAD